MIFIALHAVNVTILNCSCGLTPAVYVSRLSVNNFSPKVFFPHRGIFRKVCGVFTPADRTFSSPFLYSGNKRKHFPLLELDGARYTQDNQCGL